MSTYITDAQMADMRRLLGFVYMDTCLRLIYTPGTGDYGYGGDTYVEGASLSCLFVAKARPDAMPGTEVLQIDAELHLPRTTTLLPSDRVTITHLHGDEVDSPQTFRIVAGPIVDHDHMHASLQLVTE
jgi:hypothetical protein